jgi:phosphatidylglycerophosphate synthase
MSRELPTSTPSRLATLANLLTLTRAVAVPFLALAIVHGAERVAVGLFVWAVATDFADGRLARRRGQASSFGGLLDHGTDALLCSVGLGALAWVGVVPLALPCLVVVAFIQYMLDSRSIAGQPLRASFLGRWNGIFYFVLLGIPILRDAVGSGWPGPGLVLVLGWALVVSTLASIADRAWALTTR